MMASTENRIDLYGVRTWLRGIIDGTDTSGLSIEEHLETLVARIDATIGPKEDDQ